MQLYVKYKKTMNSNFSLDELNKFIVQAKTSTYVGNGEKTISCRTGCLMT